MPAEERDLLVQEIKIGGLETELREALDTISGKEEIILSLEEDIVSLSDDLLIAERERDENESEYLRIEVELGDANERADRFEAILQEIDSSLDRSGLRF